MPDKTTTMVFNAPNMAISSQFSWIEMPSMALFDNFSSSSKSGMIIGKLKTAIKVAEFSACAAIPAMSDSVDANPIDPNTMDRRYKGILPTGFPITQE
jgi:hypothetical protein